MNTSAPICRAIFTGSTGKLKSPPPSPHYMASSSRASCAELYIGEAGKSRPLRLRQVVITRVRLSTAHIGVRRL